VLCTMPRKASPVTCPWAASMHSYTPPVNVYCLNRYCLNRTLLDGVQPSTDFWPRPHLRLLTLRELPSRWPAP